MHNGLKPVKARKNVETSSLKDGICPSCGSDKIRSGASVPDKNGLRGGNRIPINAVQHTALDNYVCIDCGYIESYISDRDVLRRITHEWPKVPPIDKEA